MSRPTTARNRSQPARRRPDRRPVSRAGRARTARDHAVPAPLPGHEKRAPHVRPRGEAVASRTNVGLDVRRLRAMLTGGAIGAGGFVLLALAMVFSFYLYFQLSGRILAGVRAG